MPQIIILLLIVLHNNLKVGLAICKKNGAVSHRKWGALGLPNLVLLYYPDPYVHLPQNNNSAEILVGLVLNLKPEEDGHN